MKSIPSLGHHNYSSDQNLLKRLAFAQYCRPQIDLLKQIVRLLGITKGQAEKKLIDVGCGNGQNLVQIRANGFSGELFGVDIAEGILKIAQKSNRAKKTRIHFSVGDALALEFPDNVF
ncbi:MAG: class I SAM-dependent methyltransferase, partial [Patescibacteria group bacterium]